MATDPLTGNSADTPVLLTVFWTEMIFVGIAPLQTFVGA